MLTRDLTRLALTQLNRNLRRSLLAIIGFMVGVAALIAMDTLGRATSYYLTSFMENMGQANIIRVKTKSSKGIGPPGRSFAMQDVAAIRRNIVGVREVSGVVTDFNSRISLGKRVVIGRLTAVEAPFFSMYGTKLKEGHWFSSEDYRLADASALLGSELGEKLFADSSAEGAVIIADGVAFKVAGVLQATIFEDYNSSIFVPLSTGLRRVYDCRSLDTVLIKTMSLDNVEDVEDDLHRFMASQSGNFQSSFEVRVNKEALKRLRESILVLKVFILLVSAVTLFLGGTGIMNVFLASIAERKTEIGIRKAVGATDWDIAIQILTEVAIICLISSGLGLALGLGLIRGVVLFTGHPELGSVTFFHLAAYVLFAIFIGVVFSLSPAMQAARKDVVEAIRGN